MAFSYVMVAPALFTAEQACHRRFVSVFFHNERHAYSGHYNKKQVTIYQQLVFVNIFENIKKTWNANLSRMSKLTCVNPAVELLCERNNACNVHNANIVYNV